MPNIPKYSRRKFQSTYVGGPQTDKSGSIIAGAVAEATAPILEQQTKKEEAKIQASIDQQANNALIKYGIAYQEEAKVLQEKYASDPSKFPAAIAEKGRTLAQDRAKGLPDERVNARFMGGTSALIKQSAAAALNWVGVKQDENALIAANDSVRLTSIKTSQDTTVEGFKANLNALLEEVRNIPNFKQGDEEIFLAEKVPGLLETSMYNRLEVDKDGLEKDLKGEGDEDVYADVPGFSGELRNKFLKAIKSRRAEERRALKEAQTNNFDDAMDKFNRRELTFSDIRDLSKTENPADGIKDSQVNFLNKALSSRVIAEASDLAKDKPKAKTFKNLIDDFADNRLDRAEKIERLLDAFADGVLLPEEEKQLREMVKPFQDAKTALRNKNILDRTGQVFDRVASVFGEDTKAAMAVRSFWTWVREGKDPDEGARLVVSKAEADKVIADNPSLSSSEQPVEDAYRAQTVKFLKDNELPSTEENIRIGVENLKLVDGS